jgi:hypothetical protein
LVHFEIKISVLIDDATTMTPPTREEFLNHIHRPLARDGDNSGSPTKSTMRYRWRELRDWDAEADARNYWNGLPTVDKEARIGTRVSHWDSVLDYFDANETPYTSESSLRGPFEAAYLNGHNHAIKGASDAHAAMWTGVDATGLEEPPVGNADFMFVYNKKLAGVIELKTWWKVDQAQIDDVRAGNNPAKVNTL